MTNFGDIRNVRSMYNAEQVDAMTGANGDPVAIVKTNKEWLEDPELILGRGAFGYDITNNRVYVGDGFKNIVELSGMYQPKIENYATSSGYGYVRDEGPVDEENYIPPAGHLDINEKLENRTHTLDSKIHYESDHNKVKEVVSSNNCSIKWNAIYYDNSIKKVLEDISGNKTETLVENLYYESTFPAILEDIPGNKTETLVENLYYESTFPAVTEIMGSYNGSTGFNKLYYDADLYKDIELIGMNNSETLEETLIYN